MRKLFFKILYFTFLHKLFFILNKKKIITLMFHRVNPNIDHLWPSISPSTFENLIKLILKNAQIISIKNIFENNFKNKNKLIFTFDDGYKDFLHYALPIIKKYNLDVNLNICPKLVSNSLIPWTQKINFLLKKNNLTLSKILKEFSIEYNIKNINSLTFNFICDQIHNLNNEKYKKFIYNLNKIPLNTENILLNWNEIIYCFQNGVIIGNHSNSHLNVDKLNYKELDFEINKSRIFINNIINNDTYIFSIPNGKINEKSLKFISDTHKIILFSNESSNLAKFKKSYIGIKRINISVNDPYEEFFRTFGFHSYFKSSLRYFFFKKNNKAR